MLRQLLDLLSPAGDGARLSVLIFHRVRPAPDPLLPGHPDAAAFEALLRRLTSWCNVLPLPEAAARLRRGALPERSLCITFDDGYADNCTVAAPILRRFGVSATFFIATGYLSGGCMFNDRVIEAVRAAPAPVLDLSDLALGVHPLGTIEDRQRAISSLIGGLKYLPVRERERAADEIARRAPAANLRDLMMTREQVRELHALGMTIGAHTVTHPILARIPDDAAREEIAGSKRALERELGAPVTVFAYPNGKPGGDYGAGHVAMVREAGFEAACSTAWGVASRASDPFQIPRFTPWDRAPWRFGLRLAQNLRRTAYATA
jgi:peptidoglycan/xylan/chitin deacetylase (PgdA/CDA1 family)